MIISATRIAAIALSEPFMQRVIADLDNDWTLTGEEVERAIKDMH